jgi:hypothetical protein
MVMNDGRFGAIARGVAMIVAIAKKSVLARRRTFGIQRFIDVARRFERS